MRRQIGSHAATLFCSFCLLHKKDLEETDQTKFPVRSNEQHLLHAKEWLALDSYKGRQSFMKKYSARWSVLNELPYWRPVDHCSIELMHALILGDLKDHSLRFLYLPSAAKQLQATQEKEEEWQMDDHFTALPFTNLFPAEPKKNPGKRKRTEEPNDEPTSLKPAKRGRNTQPGPSLQGRQSKYQPNPVSESEDSSNQSSETTQTSHSYNLRARKQAIYNICNESADTEHSEDDRNSDCTLFIG
ncbi:uncharacterized protein PGTG_16056 [Puccinia graminis f. sp. tritici CRL 75-36-700-3]|uniref:Uncharacterized protein n=1 Tax=Puccinia graminis f. sp. tritici (strain CRL 75-36-700-3 / race SCCL) TaxID=418459 RepID=E3L1P4_PUCGT|nr:uncharacterized protein PGTG_16056 [Puccinia graminis f. sp. tritici CRL 75-36-700-3]EFP90469.1 hypothetical protein PGTG_16056 [Puccinia graminis f. sp. tritici CRL 75-36-700-3]